MTLNNNGKGASKPPSKCSVAKGMSRIIGTQAQFLGNTERKAIGWDSLRSERRSTPEKPLVAVDDNQHRDPQLDNTQRVRDFGSVSPKGDVFSKPVLSSSEIYIEDKAEKQ